MHAGFAFDQTIFASKMWRYTKKYPGLLEMKTPKNQDYRVFGEKDFHGFAKQALSKKSGLPPKLLRILVGNDSYSHEKFSKLLFV